MDAVDCVILAGGRGSRLKGIVPQYFKPMLVVDGQALIVSAIKAARSAECERVILVLAPENVQPITTLLRDAEVLDEDTFIVVQHSPRGPGDAFLQAFDFVETNEVLLLMADNVFGPDDIKNVLAASGEVVVGTRDIFDGATASNFTRVTPMQSYEGPRIDESQCWEMGGPYKCWVGPVKLDTLGLRDTLSLNRDRLPADVDELKLGPYLAYVGKITSVECDTHDVGDPERVNGGERS